MGEALFFFFDPAPLGAESGIVSDTHSSGLASPRQRRRSFVSSDFTKSAMPLSSDSTPNSAAVRCGIKTIKALPCKGSGLEGKRGNGTKKNGIEASKPRSR